MKRCPNCGGKRFVVTAHVTQDWVVDENEDWLNTYNECCVVVHQPDDDDLWECYECGYDAAGSKFNVKE